MLRVSCDLGLASKQRREASRRNENKQRREASRLYKNTDARHREETSHYRKLIGGKRGTDTHLSFFES
ncbi:MAG: hypothetical protein VSS75_009325 [Candidatus Parabeggiatoa sp.]|nr:hypothetical protein [Candidatus Parabeggiatoa sp.]